MSDKAPLRDRIAEANWQSLLMRAERAEQERDRAIALLRQVWDEIKADAPDDEIVSIARHLLGNLSLHGYPDGLLDTAPTRGRQDT